MNSKRLDHLAAFSVTDGGPGTEVMKRLRFVRPELGHGSARTALILAILTWLPLFVLCVAEGLAFRGVKIPFLYDIFAHVKFLITIPTLVLAEIPIGAALRADKCFLAANIADGQQVERRGTVAGGLELGVTLAGRVLAQALANFVPPWPRIVGFTEANPPYGLSRHKGLGQVN